MQTIPLRAQDIFKKYLNQTEKNGGDIKNRPEEFYRKTAVEMAKTIAVLEKKTTVF